MMETQVASGYMKYHVRGLRWKTMPPSERKRRQTIDQFLCPEKLVSAPLSKY